MEDNARFRCAIMIAWKAKRKKERGDKLSIDDRDTGRRQEQGDLPALIFSEGIEEVEKVLPHPGGAMRGGERAAFLPIKTKKSWYFLPLFRFRTGKEI